MIGSAWTEDKALVGNGLTGIGLGKPWRQLKRNFVCSATCRFQNHKKLVLILQALQNQNCWEIETQFCITEWALKDIYGWLLAVISISHLHWTHVQFWPCPVLTYFDPRLGWAAGFRCLKTGLNTVHTVTIFYGWVTQAWMISTQGTCWGNAKDGWESLWKQSEAGPLWMQHYATKALHLVQMTWFSLVLAIPWLDVLGTGDHLQPSWYW